MFGSITSLIKFKVTTRSLWALRKLSLVPLLPFDFFEYFGHMCPLLLLVAKLVVSPSR